MGQEPGAGAAASNRVIRRRRRDDGIAGAAGELGPDMPDHLEPARHIIERLGDILADPAQGAATGGGRRRARDASPPRAAGAPATCAGPAFALQWRPRPPLPRPARPRRAARPGRLPALRSPTRAARLRAPASPTNGRTRRAGIAPAGSTAWRSPPGRRLHRATPCATALHLGERPTVGGVGLDEPHQSVPFLPHGHRGRGVRSRRVGGA